MFLGKKEVILLIDSKEEKDIRVSLNRYYWFSGSGFSVVFTEGVGRVAFSRV